jgi:protease PrsW
MLHLLAQSILSLLPVLVFLLALELIDTYKLVQLRRVLETIAAGCLIGLLCYFLNTAVSGSANLAPATWARLGAPVVEEILKAAFVFSLIRAGKVGFMVDAAICGFAVGTGFALVENLFYLPIISHAGLATAAVRGLGTAMMHGGCTAIFGLISVNRAEFREAEGFRAYLPGLAIAILIHALYNQAFLPPATSAALLLILLPVNFSLIFWQSEKALERWMGAKLDKDMDLLHMIATSTFSQSHAGKYLRSLENSFAPVILGDILCYLQLSLELSAQAKGNLLRREMGFPIPPDPALPGRLKELHYLEKQIGRAGKLALAPLLGSSRRDIWEIHQLQDEKQV